jgi:PI-3-kinase-related kinase SMG-1
MVRYATHLKDVLERGFATTPTTPWVTIIPQLFASLSNPHRWVRKWLSELVCRLAEDYPHLIIFPAVVGASSASVSGPGEKRGKG